MNFIWLKVLRNPCTVLYLLSFCMSALSCRLCSLEPKPAVPAGPPRVGRGAPVRGEWADLGAGARGGQQNLPGQRPRPAHQPGCGRGEHYHLR